MKDERMNDQRERSARQESSEPLTTEAIAGAAAARRAPAEREPPAEMRDEHTANETNAPLFETGETEDFRSRWNHIQVQFVDEPRRSVEQADELVAQTMKRLAEVFAQERQRLEQEWDRGDNVSTEDLRIALQRYRSFFDRLLSV